MKLSELLSKSARHVLSVLYPPTFQCDLCRRENFNGKHLCDKCNTEMPFNNGTICPLCGRKTVRPELCLDCKKSAPIFDKARSALLYSDAGRHLVSQFKTTSPYLKDYFAELLMPLAQELLPYDGILFVPMTPHAEYKRGYNQTKILAKELSKKLNIPLCENILVKRKDSNEQKSLNHQERIKNLEGCFLVHDRKACRGKTFLLVDDVITTGATANEISKLLKSAGAAKVYLLTVASVIYRLNNEQAIDPLSTDLT